MQKILAPTRGGEASYPNQDKVIALAKERGDELVFLYITDISFLDHHSAPVLFDLEEELDEMGAFLLAMAQERAAKVGVNAQAIVRRGNFNDVLKEVITELGMCCVVLGSPETDTGMTTIEYLRELAEDLADTLQSETIVLEKGEIVFQHGPG
jgi:nucleotide-binding universal stress UspA family protein